MGGDIDFLVSLVHGIGWVGLVITWLLNPPIWFGFAVILAGLTLIYWDNNRAATQSMSAQQTVDLEGSVEHQRPAVASVPISFLALPLSEANLGAYINSSRLIYSAATQIADMTGNVVREEVGHHGLFEHVTALGVKNTRELEEALQKEYQIVIRLPHFLVSMAKVRRSDVVSFLLHVMEYRRFSLAESYEFSKELTASSSSVGFIKVMRDAIRDIEINLKS